MKAISVCFNFTSGPPAISTATCQLSRIDLEATLLLTLQSCTHTFGNLSFKGQKVLISCRWSHAISLLHCSWQGNSFCVAQLPACERIFFPLEHFYVLPKLWFLDFWLIRILPSMEKNLFLFGPCMCSHNTIISNTRWIKTEKPQMNTCKAKQQIRPH